MSLIERIQEWWVINWLRKPPQELPKPQLPELFQIRGASFIDHFAERNSDTDTINRHDKILQAVSDAKAELGPWGKDT